MSDEAMFDALCMDLDKNPIAWDNPTMVYDLFRQKCQAAASLPKRRRVLSRQSKLKEHSLSNFIAQIQEERGCSDSAESIVARYWGLLGHLVEKRAEISDILPSTKRIHFDEDKLEDNRPHKVVMILSLLLLEMEDDISDPKRLQISFFVILLGLGGDLAVDAHITLLLRNRAILQTGSSSQEWISPGSLTHMCLLHLFRSPTPPHPVVLQRLGQVLCLLPNCIPRGLILFCISFLTAHPDMVRVELCAKMVLMNVDYWKQPCPPIWHMMSKFPVLHPMLIRLLLRCPDAAHMWLSNTDVSTCKSITQLGLLNVGMFPILCHQDHRKTIPDASRLLQTCHITLDDPQTNKNPTPTRKQPISTLYACTQSDLLKMLYRRHLQLVPNMACNMANTQAQFSVEDIIDRMPCAAEAKQWMIHYLSFPLVDVCMGIKTSMTMEKMQFQALQELLAFNEAAQYLQMDSLIMRIQQVLIQMLLSHPTHVHQLYTFSVEHATMEMLQDTCVEVACVQPVEMCSTELRARVLSQLHSRTDIFDDYILSL